MEIWPAILVTGVSFHMHRFRVQLHPGPELVKGHHRRHVSMVCLVAFLRVWKPRTIGPRLRAAPP